MFEIAQAQNEMIPYGKVGTIVQHCNVTPEMENEISNRKKQDICIGKEKLSENSMKLLLNNDWLNDEIINAYLELLFNNALGICLLNSFTIFPYNRSIEELAVHAIRSRGVCRKISNKDCIVMPINDSQGKHWLLLVVHTSDRHIEVLDSLGKSLSTYTDLFKKVTLFLSAHLAVIDPSRSIDSFSWTISSPSLRDDFPKQVDGINCGVFVAIFAKLAVHRTTNKQDTTLRDAQNE
ncbi:sentrin-specific protease 2-like [Diadema setosum]|uniref:sentrin-specific protease 2-like n=1 Tax=Diadema setosum TaxID=31175 RepID=UPI003B3BDF49